ncbi:MAG: hypothetical protein ACJ72D_11455 [Marmoricola sp.]
MGNTTLPTPVFIAGGALCLVAGYLIGTVAGPDTPDRTTATVVSFDTKNAELCLSGSSVKDEPGVSDGVLCGTWNHSLGAIEPRKGDKFRFVSMKTKRVRDSESTSVTVLYGTVVR